MDQPRPQDPQPSKQASMSWHREHSDESADKRPADSSASSTKDEKRPIRRVRSPSRPRAWMSSSSKSKAAGPFYKPRFPRDDHPFYKPGFSSRYHYFKHRSYFNRRDHFHPKLHHLALREREREKERYEQRERDREKERYEQREGAEGSSPPKPNTTTRPFLTRHTPSRDKDMQFTTSQSGRNQSRERDHRGTKSKERERSRDGELPSTTSQTAARDRAIQQKRREIDEVYYQECEMFGLVVKMLIAKDPSLEQPIQSSLQENLRDIGKRCVEAMEKFIEEYDSKELSH